MTTPPDPDVRASSLDSSALLARMPEASLFQFRVVQRLQLTPALCRIRLTADGLSDLDFAPGQDFMLSVPAEVDGTSQQFRRRYTIRQLDRTDGILDLDIVLHGDGPGARWAAAVVPGDQVEGIGPRGKISVDPEAAWHLFCGDASALPVTSAMVESLASGARAMALLEVDGADDELAVSPAAGVDLQLTWLYRGENDGSPSPLVDAVRALALPDGPGHAYLNGELSVVNQLRKVLVERGMDAAQISMKPYWRRGVSNAAHGEPERD